MQEFELPDVGEGLTEAEIVAWKVKPGDSVTINQVVVEIETAKSLVELPSPFAGTVEELLVDSGQTVAVGSPIIRISGSSDNGEVADTVSDANASISKNETESGAVLVGYGVRDAAATRRRKPTTVRDAGPAPAPTKPSTVPAASASPVVAKPPIRKLAKDLDVDLSQVTATGLAGEVTREDVISHAQQASVFRNITTPAWSEEREERIPVKGIRKVIADGMVDSAFSAPHVSVFVDVDATRTMEFVKHLKSSTDFAGVKVSPLLVMAKAIIWAIRRNPMVNSTFSGDEIVVHHYVNLGIAAATPRGLVVPNIKDAQDLTLLELAKALEHLTTTARAGRTQPAEMANGTITISNIGVFGMDSATPILNPGEVGIMALGTIKQKPWVVDGEVRPRFVTTVGGSFDHRVIDGDIISRFVADVASILEEPALLLD
ncbi:dihydrolipoamide acetyltransferase family protein [Humidisolicoccus flavus]|uniref:dihydrolipoamide acetyltransferase family protein n=1 Tax=Humidisolicoccus flavus TaxID=3111414 RepID=UPI00324CEF80